MGAIEERHAKTKKPTPAKKAARRTPIKTRRVFIHSPFRLSPQLTNCLPDQRTANFCVESNHRFPRTQPLPMVCSKPSPSTRTNLMHRWLQMDIVFWSHLHILWVGVFH